MKKILFSILSIAALVATQSCNTDFDTDVKDIKITNGDADFSKYVALGNSLTSGYRDNALYADGQKESYPSMLAQQMKLAGGGEFKQALMPNNSGGFTNLLNPNTGDFAGKYVLTVGCNNALAPNPTAPGGTLDNVTPGGPYQNLGVPGAKTAHLIAPGYGNPAGLATGTANPYFTRFATSAATSVLADALAQNPSFVSLWIGNNDVLGYATTGGDGTNPITPVDGTVGVGFNSTYTYLINSLFPDGTKRKGVIANIPDVTAIPFFTTVPNKPVTALSNEQAAQLNAAYAPYNAGLLQVKNLNIITEAEYQSRIIKFNPGSAMNGAVILDKDLKDLTSVNPALKSFRQTTAKDLIILTASSLMKPYDRECNPKGISAGTAVPLEDKYVLTQKEIEKVSAATNSYNTTIKALAASKGLAFVDANAKMKELGSKSGIQWNGVKYTATFVTGGAFSLDGVHLTGRGYGVIANSFIKAINDKYNSTLPLVDINTYSGIKFP